MMRPGIETSYTSLIKKHADSTQISLSMLLVRAYALALVPKRVAVTIKTSQSVQF
jgi:hypothetical protein